MTAVRMGEMKVLVLMEIIQTRMYNEKNQNVATVRLQRGHSEEAIHLKDDAEVNTAIYIELARTLPFELKNKNSQILLGSILTFKLKCHINENVMKRVQMGPDLSPLDWY